MGKILRCIKQRTNDVLQWAINWLGFNQLGADRPFMTLFLAAFLVIGFLPMMIYVGFTIVSVSLGVFLLVVIEGGIIIVATVVLLACLIIPACIAGGVSAFVCAIYFALSQMRQLVDTAVNAPQKLFSFDRQVTMDEKPKLVHGKARFRRARISYTPDNDSDSESDDVKGSFRYQAHWVFGADRVRA